MQDLLLLLEITGAVKWRQVETAGTDCNTVATFAKRKSSVHYEHVIHINAVGHFAQVM